MDELLKFSSEFNERYMIKSKVHELLCTQKSDFSFITENIKNDKIFCYELLYTKVVDYKFSNPDDEIIDIMHSVAECCYIDPITAIKKYEMFPFLKYEIIDTIDENNIQCRKIEFRLLRARIPQLFYSDVETIQCMSNIILEKTIQCDGDIPYQGQNYISTYSFDMNKARNVPISEMAGPITEEVVPFKWDGDLEPIYKFMSRHNQECSAEFLNFSISWFRTIYKIKNYMSRFMERLPYFINCLFFGTTDFHYKITHIDDRLVFKLRQVYTSLYSIDDVQLHGLYCDYMTKNQYRREFYSAKYVIDYEPDFLLYVLSRSVGINGSEDNEKTWKLAGTVMGFLVMNSSNLQDAIEQTIKIMEYHDFIYDGYEFLVGLSMLNDPTYHY